MAQTNPISRLPWAQDSFKTGVGWGVFGGARGIQGDLQAQIPCLNDNLSGDDTFVPCRFAFLLGCGSRPAGQTQFAMSSLCAEALGKFEPLTGPASESERSHGFGGGEIQRGAQLVDCKTEKATLQGDGVCGELR